MSTTKTSQPSATFYFLNLLGSSVVAALSSAIALSAIVLLVSSFN